MASNDIRTFVLQFGKVTNNGVECENQTPVIAGSSNIALNCIDAEACIYKVQVGPDVTEPCFTVILTCTDCPTCTEEKTYCLCDTIDDCQDCEICNQQGFCEQLCETDHCLDGTCVECSNELPCICNLVCENGQCNCPAGTTYNAETGCCDECATDNDCEDCELCQKIDGVNTCVPKVCTTGVCNPDTNECVECNASGDCLGDHECCNVQHECECCPGFHRVDGICVSTCQFDSDCDACEICDPLVGCIPLDCGNKVCNPETNSCEEPCDGNCPPGQGCLNGFCVDCATLSCSGVISQCSQAQGCDCNGDVCEYVNCNTSNCVDWVVTDPVVVPGTQVPGSGVNAPSFTVQFTQLGIVTMQGGSGLFLDYQITVTETGGNVGTWSVEGTVLGNGASATFKLSDPTNVQWNNVGFEVTYVGNSGQTGYIDIYNTNWFGGDGFVGDLYTLPAAWAYDAQGQSVPPTFNGSSFTPGNLKLCPCGEDSDIIGYSWTTTEGNLTLTFTPLQDGCVRAVAQGCGTGEGTVTIECAGIQTTLPLPSLPFDLSGANCCDPLTDPNCNGTPGDGFGCDEFTVVNGDLVVSNTNFITGDGYGLFRGVFQPGSIGYSIPQWIHVARTVCWSVTGTVREATSFIPPVLAHLFHDVEYRNGDGCLKMGENCEIKISDCRKVQAEFCFHACEEFTVTIDDNNPVFTAYPSLGNNVQVSYAWTTNTALTGTGQVFTIPNPNSTITSVTVVATLSVNGVVCTASDNVLITLDAIEGCTNINACNYDSTATVDDGSCVIVQDGTYDCGFGFVPGLKTELGEDNPVVTYIVTGGILVNATLVSNQALAPGSYVVGVKFNGVLTCEYELEVPICYTCVDDECVAASTLSNLGFESSDCDESCGCSIVISPYFLRPGSLAKIYVNATGGTGLHIVSIIKSGGGPVLFSNGTFAGAAPAVTVDVCDGNYAITVADNNCTQTANIGVNGYDCADSTMGFGVDTRCQGLGLGNGPCFDCSTNQVLYTLIGDECATSYTREFQDVGETTTYGSVVTSAATGQGAIPTGVYPGDGLYKLTITSNNSPACELVANMLLDCVIPSECEFDLDLPPSLTVEETEEGDLEFTAHWHLLSGGGLFDLELIKMVGGNPFACTGGSEGATMDVITNQAGVLGLNETVFSLIPNPVVTTCYKLVITKVGDESCVAEAFYSFNPFAPSAPCGGTITSPTEVSAIYDDETEMVYVSWAFSSTSGNMTVKIYVASTAVCDIDVDPLVVDSAGHGESGDGWFGPIPQLQGQDQCITVIVHDTSDETCSDTVESAIPGCECDVEILTAEVDPDLEALVVTFRTKCTSGDVDFFLTGDVTETQSIADASEDGQWVNDTIEIAIDPYPSVGGVLDLEMTDNADIACTQTMENINIPENCVGCSQVVAAVTSAIITEVRDEDANLIASGSYDLTIAADLTLLENDIVTGVVSQGGNFCPAGTGVDANNTTFGGIDVNQDDSLTVVLDYVLLQAPAATPAAWVGTLKSYFGDCGCETGRLCDYTVDIAVPASGTIRFYYGRKSGTSYSSRIDWAGMTQTPSPSFLTDIEQDITDALTNLSGCEYTVGSVSVTYDEPTDVLTIDILGTNAAIGLAQATLVGSDTFFEFTQSGCV